MNSRMENRKKRRELIRTIIDNLITVYSINDTQLEAIPLQNLFRMNIDAYDYIKWTRANQMERHDKGVFLKKFKNIFENGTESENGL